MLNRVAAVALVAVVAVVAFVGLGGCHRDADLGLEMVRVPATAYGAPDAGADRDGAIAGDGGLGPLVLCIEPPKQDGGDDDDESSDECPPHYQGRAYDEHVTQRHRNKDDKVCCYRRGRFPRGEEPTQNE